MDNPGPREDAQGPPFVCPKRRALRQALAQAQVPDADVQVLFLYEVRPRGVYDRRAANSVCLPILEDQLRASGPKVLLALGNTVVQAVMGPDASVREPRGRWQTFCGLPLLASYHPLAVRRRPNLAPLLVQDIAQARDRLERLRDGTLANPPAKERSAARRAPGAS